MHVRGDEYVYIGDRVLEFTAPDRITEFHGIFGFSDVVYAFAISQGYVYFLPDGKYLPRAFFGTDGLAKDPYIKYYSEGGETVAKKLKRH